MKKILSVVLKVIIVIASILGVIFSMVLKENEYMGGATSLLYFTIQSNIWICLVSLLFLIIQLLGLINKKDYFKRWMYVIRFIFTVSITLTGIVFCFVLAPLMPAYAWSINNVLTHIVVPLCSIIDLFIDKANFKYKHSHAMLSLIPPAYYLVFAIICFVNDVKFAGGVNYPYFFLNFQSPAGIFGFSSEPPYVMGTFYWIIIMLLMVLAFAYTYLLIHNKTHKEK